MYLFQISNYDDPAVDRETAELLHRRLEAESRRRCPAMWNAIDRIRTHAAKGPAREKRTVRCRIYGVFLLALGLLTLILGLMPPRTTDVIIVGGAVIIAGLLEFALARGRTPPCWRPRSRKPCTVPVSSCKIWITTSASQRMPTVTVSSDRRRRWGWTMKPSMSWTATWILKNTVRTARQTTA